MLVTQIGNLLGLSYISRSVQEGQGKPPSLWPYGISEGLMSTAHAGQFFEYADGTGPVVIYEVCGPIIAHRNSSGSELASAFRSQLLISHLLGMWLFLRAAIATRPFRWFHLKPQMVL